MNEFQVLLVAGTHGNEVNAPWLFDQWKDNPDVIRKNDLEVVSIIGNPSARELGRRYIDRDLNRSFNPSLLNDKENAEIEVKRARELLANFGPEGINPCKIIFDCHSTTSSMGNSLVVYGRRPADLALAGLIQNRMGLPIYLHEGDKSQIGFMVSSWPCGLVIEIGPVPQGLLFSKIILQTRQTLQVFLEEIENIKNGLITKTLPNNLIVHRHVKSIDFPRNLNDKVIAFIHPERDGKDWIALKEGDPLFMNSLGETYQYSENDSYVPVFINEAAYSEKGISMSYTKREIWTFSKDWMNELIAVILTH